MNPHVGSWEVLSTPVWYAPTSIEELFSIITGNPDSSVQLVAGDTGRGEPSLTYAVWVEGTTTLHLGTRVG